jgi:hypothetical protein
MSRRRSRRNIRLTVTLFESGCGDNPIMPLAAQEIKRIGTLNNQAREIGE